MQQEWQETIILDLVYLKSKILRFFFQCHTWLLQCTAFYFCICTLHCVNIAKGSVFRVCHQLVNQMQYCLTLIHYGPYIFWPSFLSVHVLCWSTLWLNGCKAILKHRQSISLVWLRHSSCYSTLCRVMWLVSCLAAFDSLQLFVPEARHNLAQIQSKA